MSDASRLAEARALCERAIFGGDPDAADRADAVLDGLEAGLALARGTVLHARFLAGGAADPRELELFSRATELHQRSGDVAGEAEACFWVGVYHQIVRDDGATALAFLERAYALAVTAGDKRAQSFAVRHLGIEDQAAGRLDEARRRFEESLALRREIGFAPGVAAGLLSLAELAAQREGPAAAEPLLAEAADVARSCGADGVLGWIEEAREALARP